MQLRAQITTLELLFEAIIDRVIREVDHMMSSNDLAGLRFFFSFCRRGRLVA